MGIPAKLALEDGTVFSGTSLGATGAPARRLHHEPDHGDGGQRGEGPRAEGADVGSGWVRCPVAAGSAGPGRLGRSRMRFMGLFLRTSGDGEPSAR